MNGNGDGSGMMKMAAKFAYFGSAAFATGRTAGVGVVFPAGASVMAPDAQHCCAHHESL